MQLSDYYLRRPSFTLDAATQATCNDLLQQCIAHPGRDLTGQLPVPVWQFCAYLTDTYPILIHGSASSSISEFELRESRDSNPFGNRSAVFAASDGIWPMFFAIVDREQYRLSLINGCFRVVNVAGERSTPYYYFSITNTPQAAEPWRPGTLYILPRATFEQHPPRIAGDLTYEYQEWASLVPVQPYAKIAIAPNDFPFLGQIQRHDDALIAQRAAADPEGWPWLHEP